MAGYCKPASILPAAMRETQLPFYAKATLILLGLALLVFTIHIGSSIIFPLFFAAIFAILLTPVQQRLEKWHVPRVLAIALTVLLGFAVFLSLLFFIYWQGSQLSTQMPLFKAKFLHMSTQFQAWLLQRYGVSNERLMGWVNKGGSSAAAWASGSLTAVTGLLVSISLLPVYVFLLLFYRPMLVEFMTQVFARRSDNAGGVQEIMSQSKRLIQSYMVGLLLEAAAVATLNTIGLLALGIPYAVLLGVVGALLNMIPYVGGLVAIALPVFMAFVTKDGLGYPLGVVGVYMAIQFLDNHLLIPYIVASKVKVNALVAIVGVLIGNAIGGVAGMFLALPVIAILKIIFDRIEPLKPWGLLLGDHYEPTSRWRKKPAAVPVVASNE
jgi:AI-2 transport protein TqsA